jgi:hypothetical protein
MWFRAGVIISVLNLFCCQAEWRGGSLVPRSKTKILSRCGISWPWRSRAQGPTGR